MIMNKEDKMIDVNKLYNLSYLIRYSNVKRIKNESVAEHSFYVAVEVLKLYEDYIFDLGKALGMAITHDFAESDIDDVNHKIKHTYPEVAKALKDAEKSIIKKYPDFIQDYIKEYDEGDSIEHLIVHIADAAQCITYSKNEIELGNKSYMEKVYKESIERVNTLKSLIKMDYIRNNDSMSFTLSEYFLDNKLRFDYNDMRIFEEELIKLSKEKNIKYGFISNHIGDEAYIFDVNILNEYFNSYKTKKSK